MRESPIDEYLTGVLSPIVNKKFRDVEGESEIPFGESQVYEEETDDTNVDTPPMLSPALDPKSRPPSMGLSFTLRNSGKLSFRICLTWARYIGSMGQDGKTIWQRNPRILVKRIDESTPQVIWIDGDGNETVKEKAEVYLQWTMRRQDSKVLLSMFLVNAIKFQPEQPGDRPKVEDHIFQPQIRVRLDPGTELSAVDRVATSDEDKELEFLYRFRPVYARGFLVSAVWRDIDPERPNSKKSGSQSADKIDAFKWIDGELADEIGRNEFSPPDVRTEFVPAYLIPTPDFNWKPKYGPEPQLRAAYYAESWNPDDLRSALDPLASGYAAWISELEKTSSSYSGQLAEVSARLLSDCKGVLARIRKGIDLLIEDDDVRLSFCLANKAIDLQSSWSRPGEFRWRPFQLAFLLMTVESLVNRGSPDRLICDLLWVATGGGKTEAYLAISIFTIAYRRRHSQKQESDEKTGYGVSVLTRYTLRLLTIQQFRRALIAVTAAEFLRAGPSQFSGKRGWRPSACDIKDDCLWGSIPFSIGLWVGSSVTPNKMMDRPGDPINYGALSILRGKNGEGEPAQVLKCPACPAVLAISRNGIKHGKAFLHLVLQSKNEKGLTAALNELNGEYGDLRIDNCELTRHAAPEFFTLSFTMSSRKRIRGNDLDALWPTLQGKLGGAVLASVRASRPGYFLREYIGQKGERQYDFDIICPNPKCPLHIDWSGGSPSGLVNSDPPAVRQRDFPDGNGYIEVHKAFRNRSPFTSDRVPIPAFTIDDQVYHRLPSIVVATVDKFARPPFEPRTAALFGNVQYHHCIWGYYRPEEHMIGNAENKDGHPMPAGSAGKWNFVKVHNAKPPDLILQDELHLIEGPLGSLAGFYETAIDFLCSEQDGKPVKYIASTATVRRAEQQVQSMFVRSLQKFPPYGLSVDDRFFVNDYEDHQSNEEEPGRLYVGICAPGRGPLTPLRNIFARLLQTAEQNRADPNIDSFWTLTAYFNAIRELAGARSLYRQDIPERLAHMERTGNGTARQIPDVEKSVELSSRTNSVELPALLDELSSEYPNAPDSLFTTSMFGTGVDISRIGLMIVNGQPKTTSSYIQSTGRVGRKRGALVVTFLRASRPRDLNHYEFFCGYHRQLHRFVEPVTVYPFSPAVVERSGGPVSVFILRNMVKSTVPWHSNDSAIRMADERTSSPEIRSIIRAMDFRVENQPGSKAESVPEIHKRIESVLDAWHNIAKKNSELKFVEFVFRPPSKHPVVLGGPEHNNSKFDVVYRNVQTSLRDVEETTGFQA